jgi:hypothetical protein
MLALVLMTAFLAGSATLAAADTIKIGGTYNLTGGMASLDVPAANGSKLAVKEINAAGGVLGKQIQFVLYDGKTDSATNGNIATQLVNSDKVVAIVGNTDSDSALAIGPIAQAAGIPYLTAGDVYNQNFDSLPDPGLTSVNSANPVTINGITYSLSNPFDFAFPVSASGTNGGLGLSSLAGWYGLADPTASVGTRFGATDGDQTTGGQISFGLPNSSNRALGLLATSTTGYTAFGLKLINGTSQTLNFMNLQFTGEVWRQSDLAKTLEFYYLIDPSATNVFLTSATAFLPALNVSFPTVAADVGGAAVDGTAALNQTNLGVTNQVIAPWAPGAALWLVWEMASPAGKSQGLGIDNLSFSASVWPTGMSSPPLVAQASGTNLLLSCPTIAGLSYQFQYKTNLSADSWLPLGAPIPGTGAAITVTNGLTASAQCFYRLAIVP